LNEKIAKSPTISRMSALQKENPQPGTCHARKIHSTNFGDHEYRNPPKGNLENPHKLKVKRKRTSSHQEDNETMLMKMNYYWITWN
jgi:hypothetical protein